MLKNIPLTPYDVFGIFLPGAIILISFTVIYYSLVPSPPPIDLTIFSFIHWFILIIVCYLFGFIAQTFGQYLDKISAKVWSRGAVFTISDRGDDADQSRQMFEIAREKAAHVVGMDLKSIDALSLVNVIHEILSQKGEITGVEYLISREEFFRGIAAASIFASIGFVLRYFTNTEVQIIAEFAVPPKEIFLVIAMGSVLTVRRAMIRHRDMVKARVRKLVIGFLAVDFSDDATRQGNVSV